MALMKVYFKRYILALLDFSMAQEIILDFFVIILGRKLATYLPECLSPIELWEVDQMT